MEEITKLFLQDPLLWIVGIAVLIYMMRGKPWHGMYVLYAYIGVFLVINVVGITEFMAGVIVGVLANEVFRQIRKKLDKENQ